MSSRCGRPDFVKYFLSRKVFTKPVRTAGTGLKFSLFFYNFLNHFCFNIFTTELLGSCESTQTARRRRARDSSLFSSIRMEHVRWVAFKLQLATRLKSCKMVAYSLFYSTVWYFLIPVFSVYKQNLEILNFLFI
jgi:hypothetical protein